MILSGRLCHSLQIMQCKLYYDTLLHSHFFFLFLIIHDKSWGIGLVLFAMTKSCHFSQSTCRSLRLMSFQEKKKKKKQEQGYTFSIHNIFTCSKVKGVTMPKSTKERAETEFSVPETFRICELYQEEDVLWNPRSCPYHGPSPASSYSENSTNSYYYT